MTGPQENYADIRESVRALCDRFPGEYWRELDRDRAYPTAFVKALTEAGYLAALIPEEFGGSGLPVSAAAAIMEEIHAAGGNGAACHAQMYTMGTILRHGSPAQKERYLPKIATGELRLQAFGVTEPTSGTDTLSLRTVARRGGDEYVINGQKIWTSRAEHSDLMLLLARTTPKEEVKKRTDGLSVFLVDMRKALEAGTLTIKPIRTVMNHATTEVFFDDLRVPAENLIGEEGKGFRYILSGMNTERILIASECIGDAKWFIRKAADYALVFSRERTFSKLRFKSPPTRFQSPRKASPDRVLGKLTVEPTVPAEPICASPFTNPVIIGLVRGLRRDRILSERTMLRNSKPNEMSLMTTYIPEEGSKIK